MMSENELRASRYIENFTPPNIVEESVHQFCSSAADAFLGQIEYGKDYVVRTELAKEDWANGLGTKYTYSLEFDELVRCRDCKYYYGECMKPDGNGDYLRLTVPPTHFCGFGDRRA